jgi:hypothetical protein
MQVHGNRQDLLFLLITDERGLEPEDGLGKVQRPGPLDGQLQSFGRTESAPNAAAQIMWRKIQTAQVRLRTAPPLHGTAQETVDQRRAQTGKLCPGVFRDCLGVEGNPQDVFTGKSPL